LSPPARNTLLALRLRAMRESLQRLGRFSEQRVRERLEATFDPAQTQHIVLGGNRVGFIALLAQPQSLKLDHLYIEPAYQSRGLGQQVMQWACSRADAAQLPIELTALQRSASNRFYKRHGFVALAESEWDIHYRRPVQAPSVQVVRQLWAAIQARDWPAARALLRPDMQTTWWTSGERFESAEAYIEVQARYPEGWTIHLVECQRLEDGRVLSIVRVDHPPLTFFATVICSVEGGVVTRSEEYWATAEEPPAWRAPGLLPAHSRFDAHADPRAIVPVTAAL
jgi:GNAT superfamily N-acetyltransferase/ketosteroid isomerase-like protein